MGFGNLEGLENDRNFWTVVVGFMYLAGVLQVVFGELLLGITTLGMAVTFTAVAYQKLNED